MHGLETMGVGGNLGTPIYWISYCLHSLLIGESPIEIFFFSFTQTVPLIEEFLECFCVNLIRVKFKKTFIFLNKIIVNFIIISLSSSKSYFNYVCFDCNSIPNAWFAICIFVEIRGINLLPDVTLSLVLNRGWGPF